MKKELLVTIIIIIIVSIGLVWKLSKQEVPLPVVTNFKECAMAGYPILETYPEQCRTPDDRLFTNDMIVRGTEFGNPVTLLINEQAKFSDGLVVTLIEINDSRCKPDVVCIWAGEFSSRFKLLGGDIKRDTDISLGTVTAKSITQGGYTITINDATENTSTITVKIESEPVVACTMEAKLCPDGSYVGRTGPNCEFTQCPNVGEKGGILPYNSGIRGIVMAGPTCPVMQDPPDPKCADKPVETNISIYRASDTTRNIAMIESRKDGTFEISLPPNKYVIMSGPYGVPFPHCPDITAIVVANSYTEISVSCDTGIR